MAEGSELRLAGFLLALLGGVLAIAQSAEPLLARGRLPGEGELLVLLGGVIALVGALRGWKGAKREAGVLALVGGIVCIVGGGTVPGVLAVVGGVLFLVR